jgi:rubrerythrin
MAAAAALAGGASAAALASCGGGSKGESSTTVSTVQLQNDAAVLNTLLDLEASAIVAYESAAAKLSGRALAAARTFGGQERAHAAALRRTIRGLGAAPMPVHSPAEYRSTFQPLRNGRDALSFALDVEDTAIGAYADALGKVATGPARVTLAAIMAVESEHAASLLGLLGRPQVPAAFVTGPPPAEGGG